MTEKKQYSEGAKTEAVRMVIEHGLSLREASRAIDHTQGDTGQLGQARHERILDRHSILGSAEHDDDAGRECPVTQGIE